MNGIVFFSTRMLDAIERFYTSQIGMEIWLKQGDCTILKHGNLLIGFCQRETSETGAMITFYYESKAEVDSMFDSLKAIANVPPKENPKYRIYQFFAKDPEGRNLEFQVFLDPIEPT